MTSQEMADKMIGAILGSDGLTFFDLEAVIGEEAIGEYAVEFPKGSNVLLWGGVSRPFAEAIAIIKRSKLTNALVVPRSEYSKYGATPRLPLADAGRADGHEPYKEPHWLPLVLEPKSIALREEKRHGSSA